MKRSHYISDIPAEPGANVRIAGWVENTKEVGRLIFIWVRDRTGVAQLTVKKNSVEPEVLETAKAIGLHDFIAAEGTVPDKITAKVGVEIIPSRIEVLSRADKPLPLDVSGVVESNLDTRLDWRAIDLRNPKQQAVFKVQAKLLEGMQEYLNTHGYLQVFTPCLIGAPSEGGAELFEVKFFDKTAYLRQDPQLHRQLLMVAGFDRIYDLGPNWRAEPSHTPRHLCEHRGCAVELSFIDDEHDVMRVEEELVVNGIKNVVEECQKEIELLGAEVEVPKRPFPELRFPEVYEILESMGKHIPRGEDLDREAEKLLARYVKEKYGHDFFFVNRFPYRVKPFYVMRVDEEPEWARSIDLVYRGLELSSGGQREHRYERIIEQVGDKGMNLENLRWFTEFFRYGAPPHGGFNIGVERLTMAMLGLGNIREAASFPRAPERLLP
ncbi:MAG TPA: aspartate--tRNA(Asn) ligase [Candidatus Caldiarchaeum subterraneum]|uniref:Aspartate--tRNA(Asp) ligase n=1 Tax=Caldiarchaeum subterraneum TaxID=311458 RepID=A0A832ZVS0_CALS0|nr:aspartate--tRNA(Asn) ligase [Candidatus Caldarchaeum subterraneum]